MQKPLRPYLLMLMGAFLLVGGWGGWHLWLPSGPVWTFEMGLPPSDSLPGIADTTGFPAQDPYQRYHPGEELDLTQFARPASVYAPWITWPVLGSDLSFTALLEQLQDFYAAGMGGIVLQDAPAPTYSGARYFQQLRFLAREAEKRGIQVDWELAAQPFAHMDRPAQSLSYGEAYVRGGKPVSLQIPLPTRDYAFHIRQAANPSLDSATATPAHLLDVYAVQARKAERSEFYWVLQDHISISPDSIFLITPTVDSSGHLYWQAPPGNWWVLAVYTVPVPAGVPDIPYPGWADPLDSMAWLQTMVEYFAPKHQIRHHIGAGLRGIQRPAQLYGADRLFHPDILQALRPDHLSTLHPYLPLLLGPGRDQQAIHRHHLATAAPFQDTIYDQRLRDQYDQIAGHRMLSQSVSAPLRWTRERGLSDLAFLSSNGIQMLEAARQHPLPGIQLGPGGGRDAFLKLVGSSAPIAEQKLLAARVWPHSPMAYTVSAQKLKLAAEKLHQTGYNHIIWPYAAWKMPSGGQQPLSTTAWSSLNQSTARDQYLLRHGRPVSDIWVYYPFDDFPIWEGEAFAWEEFLADGKWPGYDAHIQAPRTSYPAPYTLPQRTDPRTKWLNEVMPYLQALEAAGYQWSWMSASMLTTLEWDTETNQWTLKGARASAVMMPFIPAWTPALATLALEANAEEAPLYWLGPYPQSSNVYWGAAEADAQAATFAANLSDKQRFAAVSVFSDFLRLAPWPQRISFFGPTPFLRWQERLLPNGDRLFRFFNTQNKGRHGRFRLSEMADQLYWLYPSSGHINAIDPQITASQTISLYLAPLSSQYIYVKKGRALADSLLTEMPIRQMDLRQQGGPVLELEKWDLLIQPGTSPLYARNNIQLFDWRENASLRHSAAEALYTSAFAWADTTSGRRFVLDLGQVHGEAEVWLNKTAIGRCAVAPFRFDLTAALQPGYNTIEIWFRPPRFNAWVQQAKAAENLPPGSNWADLPVSTGIIGSVWLWSWDGAIPPML